MVRLLTVNIKNCLTQKNPKMCDSILVTIENATHYSQSRRENATPSSSTSPLASYKEVFPPRAQRPTWGQKKVAVVERFNKSQCIDMFDLITTKTRFDQW